MAVLLKCAACGAQVEFEEWSPSAEAVCPGCHVKVRCREGDETMAMPVSMALPEAFRPIDLDSVAGKSSLLVGRYRKQVEQTDRKENSELALARALETLAASIGHLEDRLDRQEERLSESAPPAGVVADSAEGDSPVRNGQSPTPSGAKAPVADPGDAEEEVVQLAEEGAGGEAKAKAVPVGARVLVRREAAREAHHFRREKHAHSDWDDRPAARKQSAGGFAWLMENHPKTTMTVTMLLAVALIGWTILAMSEMFTRTVEQEEAVSTTRTTDLSKMFDEDPEAAQAEIVARGFLNATSAATAAPFIFESESIQELLERYFEPIASPGDYELKLKSRARTSDGQSTFAYDVLVPGEATRRLVILPEGRLPKVFWQFFAEVGDLTWDEFLSQRPKEAVEMRVWLYEGAEYMKPYGDPSVWQNFILHDWSETQKLYAYAKREDSEYWRITDALKKDPVKFNRHSAVMALVKVRLMGEVTLSDGSEQTIVEIEEVVATSWLPKQFQAPRSEK